MKKFKEKVFKRKLVKMKGRKKWRYLGKRRLIRKEGGGGERNSEEMEKEW